MSAYQGVIHRREQGSRPIGAGDRIQDLYEREAVATRRLAYLLCGNRETAEDLVQEAFVRLIGRLGHLRDPNHARDYLRKTVVNLSRGRFRRLRVERSYLQMHASRDAVWREDLPDVGEQDEFKNALVRLPHRQRAAIVLRYYADLSERQTAEALGCSEGAVRSAVFRGMETLRRDLGERHG